MLGGISLVGVVTASLASWIVQRVSETETANRAATAAQIDELRSEIRSLAEPAVGPLTAWNRIETSQGAWVIDLHNEFGPPSQAG